MYFDWLVVIFVFVVEFVVVVLEVVDDGDGVELVCWCGYLINGLLVFLCVEGV